VKQFFLLFLAAFSLSGCLGYHLGAVKPQYLSSVHTIAVPVFTNRTYIPRIEALVTGTVIKEFQRDGTFTIADGDKADAILHGEITGVTRRPARPVRGNVLATTEFILDVSISYNLTARDGKALGPAGSIAGSTSFFVSSDVVTDERQALPLAAEQAAKSLVAQISEGW
jgi:hypothetical protein